MEKVLKFLQGKKGMIAAIIMTIVAYLSSKGIIGEQEVVLIGGLVTIFFGTASSLTGKMYGKTK